MFPLLGIPLEVLPLNMQLNVTKLNNLLTKTQYVYITPSLLYIVKILWEENTKRNTSYVTTFLLISSIGPWHRSLSSYTWKNGQFPPSSYQREILTIFFQHYLNLNLRYEFIHSTHQRSILWMYKFIWVKELWPWTLDWYNYLLYCRRHEASHLVSVFLLQTCHLWGREKNMRPKRHPSVTCVTYDKEGYYWGRGTHLQQRWTWVYWVFKVYCPRKSKCIFPYKTFTNYSIKTF